MTKPKHHARDHMRGGGDAMVTRWYNVGTDGVDGVDALLAKNPHPYATGDTPGPPPFVTGTNGFALDPDGNPGGGLRYCYGPHGIQLDCGGGITGLSPGDVITTLIGVPLPDTAKRFIDADDSLDTPGTFVAILLPSGDLVYLGPTDDGVIDGGSP